MADSHFWDFGDGNTSTEQSPSHNYKYAGNYTVTLYINNELADTKVISATPNFTADVTEGNVPFSVTFTQTGAHPTASVLWDFGDGNTSTARNPIHTYEYGGTYTVSYTVDDLTPVVKTDYITGNFYPADFTVTPLTGTAPTIVYYEATGTHYNDDTYLWDFGDGNTSDQPSGFHTYEWGGDYTVSLSGIQGLTPYEVIKPFYVGLDQPSMTPDGWSLTDKVIGTQVQFAYSNFDRTINTSRLGLSGSTTSVVRAVVPITSGKKYFEVRVDDQGGTIGNFFAGVMGAGTLPSSGYWQDLTDQVIIRTNGQVFKNGVSVYYGAFGIPPTYQIEDGYTIGFAVDMTTKSLNIYVENTYLMTATFDPSVVYPLACGDSTFILGWTLFLSGASQKYSPPAGYTSVIPNNPQPFVSGTLDATVTQYWTAESLTADSNYSSLTWDGIRYTGPGELVSSYPPSKATVQFGYLDTNITGTTGTGNYEPSIILSNGSNQQLIFGSRVLAGVQNIYLEYSDNGDVTSLITAPTTTASGATEYTLNDDGVTCEIYNGVTQVYTGASVLKRVPPGLFFALGLQLPNNEKVTLANIRLEP